MRRAVGPARIDKQMFASSVICLWDIESELEAVVRGFFRREFPPLQSDPQCRRAAALCLRCALRRPRAFFYGMCCCALACTAFAGEGCLFLALLCDSSEHLCVSLHQETPHSGFFAPFFRFYNSICISPFCFRFCRPDAAAFLFLGLRLGSALRRHGAREEKKTPEIMRCAPQMLSRRAVGAPRFFFSFSPSRLLYARLNFTQCFRAKR